MNAIWITEAKYIHHYTIYMKFNDGKEGIIDFLNLLDGKIFEPLQDVEFFKKFSLNAWTLEWSNGADFAPEFLYEHILEIQTVKI